MVCRTITKRRKMKEYITLLMHHLSFPEDAISAISEDTRRLFDNEVVAHDFGEIMAQYDKTELCDYLAMLNEMKTLSEKVGIHEYSGDLIMFLAMSKKLKQRYDERGISEEIFYNTMADLKYKCEECRLLHGIFGTFVAPWFPGFFQLRRFAFGRLQIETSQLGCDCEYQGLHFTKESKILNVHIPRTGTPLLHDQVLHSYHMAADFFADEFKDEPMLFACHSWLLYPWNMTVLSPTSNLFAFCSDFSIIAEGTNQNHEDLWRLFDCVYTGDPKMLPRDSSLRRAYADRVAKCEETGWGYGVFMLKDLINS